MSRPILLVGLLLIATAGAGCLGGNGDSSDDDSSALPPGGDQGDDARGSGSTGEGGDGSRPSWEVGDHFTWQITASENEEASWTAVVVEDLGDHYRVASTDPQVQAMEVLYDWVNVGTLDAATLSDVPADQAPTMYGAPLSGDLAGSAFPGYEGLTMYEFPLSEGASWTSSATIDGETADLTHTATEALVETPMGPADGFEIDARDSNDTLVYSYTYAPDVGWFTAFSRHDPEEDDPSAAVQWSFELTDWGHGWEGEYPVVEVQHALSFFHETDASPDNPDANPQAPAAFEVPEATTYLWYEILLFVTPAGSSQLLIEDPDGERRVFEATSEGASAAFLFETGELPAVPGVWRVLAGGTGLDVEAALELWAIQESQARLPAGG